MKKIFSRNKDELPEKVIRNIKNSRIIRPERKRRADYPADRGEYIPRPYGLAYKAQKVHFMARLEKVRKQSIKSLSKV